MLGNILPPYHSLQELNLDWILTKIKNMLRFLPDDGAVGQILRRTPHGAEWSDEQGAGGSVTSVNGMQGAVVLGAADVGALPDTYTAPVDSVNGQTGTVVLGAADVGAMPDTTVIPTDTADLTNSAGFVDAAGAAAAAPVQSVNGQTGAVALTIPTDTADLTNSAGFVNASGAAAASPVQSVNGQTGAVVIPAGITGWGTTSTITLPYTPTTDGIVVASFSPQSASNSYVFILDDGQTYMRAMSSGGTGYGMTFPVISGHRYSVQTQGNVSSSTYTFIPFA
jgi:hypothetical protein